MKKVCREEREVYFEKVYRNNFRKIYFYAKNYLVNDVDAKNVTQDVFLTFFEEIDEVDTERDVLPYLFVMARYKSMNVLRRKRVHNRFYDNEKLKHTRESIAYEALEDYTSVALYSEEIRSLVNKSLEEMPDKVRSTYELSRESHLKNREIAEMQLISIKTVEYRLNYALKILRKNLRDYLYVIICLISLMFA